MPGGSGSGSFGQQITATCEALAFHQLMGEAGHVTSKRGSYRTFSSLACIAAIQQRCGLMQLYAATYRLLLRHPDVLAVPAGLKGSQSIANTYGSLFSHCHGSGGLERWQYGTATREEAMDLHRIALCMCFVDGQRPLVLLDTHTRPAVAFAPPAPVFVHGMTRRGTGQFLLPGGGHLEHGVVLRGSTVTCANLSVLFEASLPASPRLPACLPRFFSHLPGSAVPRTVWCCHGARESAAHAGSLLGPG